MGRKLLDTFWFSSFIKTIEGYVVEYIQHLNNEKAWYTYSKMIQSKNIIPPECRIADTFFSHMTILGDLDENGFLVPPHIDPDDIITALFHVGNPTEGGSTIFFYCEKKDFYEGEGVQFSQGVYQLPFAHGRLTIGFFSSVGHGVDAWRGARGAINFNLKKSVLEYFLKTGRKYYDKFKSDGFPKGEYVIYT